MCAISRFGLWGANCREDELVRNYESFKQGIEGCIEDEFSHLMNPTKVGTLQARATRTLTASSSTHERIDTSYRTRFILFMLVQYSEYIGAARSCTRYWYCVEMAMVECAWIAADCRFVRWYRSTPRPCCFVLQYVYKITQTTGYSRGSYVSAPDINHTSAHQTWDMGSIILLYCYDIL